MADLKEIRCSVCGSESGFEAPAEGSLREARCSGCGVPLRNSDVAKVLLESLAPGQMPCLKSLPEALSAIDIYEAQATGPLHEGLKHLPGYVCSEFSLTNPNFDFDDTPVRSENLEKLTFPDASFDVVITQDVLEHLENPEAGFREIKRVLKPGGIHVFTIPFHHGRATLTRARKRDGDVEFLMPPVYHGDRYDRRASLVYTDFGEDLTNSLDAMSFPTRIALERTFYSAGEIPWITDKESHDTYLAFDAKDRILEFFRYNSLVFVSKKEGSKVQLDATGERFLPWMEDPKIHYEHLHRYRLAMDMADGRKVLDLGSGEGYGSYMLSSRAASVCGVDIDASAVRHASAKYCRENLSYVQGAITSLPLSDDERFDLIVCFEALEHISEHDALLEEVKRYLNPGGTFIVSTPDKKAYTDAADFSNPFHVKELYSDEFRALLTSRFQNVVFAGQKLLTGSRVFALDCSSSAGEDVYIDKAEASEGYVFVSGKEYKPEYIIGIASDASVEDTVFSRRSDLVDVSCSLEMAKQTLDRQFGDYIHSSRKYEEDLEKQIREQKEIIEEHASALEEKTAELERKSREIESVYKSRAWRFAEFFREMVYRRILRR